jgi:hypothetical protein
MRIQRRVPAALILLLSCLLAAPVVPAQDKKISRKDVPAAVLAAFGKAYPHAKIKGTSTETEKGTTYYEIESMDGTQARDILYLADGTASEVEEVVAASSLPGPVKSAVGNEFPKAKIAKAEKVTKGTDVSYEVHVSLGSKKGSILLSPSGTVVEKSPLKAKKEKEENEEEPEDNDVD